MLSLCLWLPSSIMKKCRKCGQILPEGAFPLVKRPGGNYTYGAPCIACRKAAKKLRYESNKESILKKQAEYQRNSDKVKRYQKEYFQKNKAKNYAATKKWRLGNAEQQRQILANDYQARKEEWVVYCAERRARLLQAVPKWGNIEAVRSIYKAAQDLTVSTGIKHHVDHIVPLNHPLVCGLHVEYNLDPIPAKANMEKGNRMWPNMP